MQSEVARRSHSDETPGTNMDIDEAPPTAAEDEGNDYLVGKASDLDGLLICMLL